MRYLSALRTRFGHNVTHYSLERYELAHKRWRIFALAMLALLFVYLQMQPTVSVDPAHIAKVTVNLNPNQDTTLTKRLESAILNPNARGILLAIEEGIFDGPNFAQVESLNRLLAQAKMRKPVAAFIYGYAHGNNYVIASNAQYIVSQETASIGGLSVSTLQFDSSDLMQRLGVKVVEQGFGRYKTKPDKNDPNYAGFMEHRSKILEDLHSWMVAQVAKNRKLSPERVGKIMDGQWYLGTKAIQLGLCDALGDEKFATQWLQKQVPYDRTQQLLRVEDYSQAQPTGSTSYKDMLSNLWGYQKMQAWYTKVNSSIQTELSTWLQRWMLQLFISQTAAVDYHL